MAEEYSKFEKTIKHNHINLHNAVRKSGSMSFDSERELFRATQIVTPRKEKDTERLPFVAFRNRVTHAEPSTMSAISSFNEPFDKVS